MNQHYYTRNPITESQQETIHFTLRGKRLTFLSDNGVFSKKRVDFGSEVLIESVDIPKHLQHTALLDVGCGYGPIGLAYAAAYPMLMVHMVDINERAVELANKNIHLNKVKNAQAYSSFIYEQVDKRDFGVILSNPPIRAGKKVVHEIIERAYEYLQSEGMLAIVIQKKQGAPSAQNKMEEVFGNCELVNREKGYWILKSVKK